MARIKVFLRYFIIFIVLYAVFDFFTYRYLVNSYKNIRTYEIIQESPSVTVKEAKATAVNGYVVAQVKNNTGEKINKTNIKLDLYNTRGNNIGTKYACIENFNQNETKEFKINFRASNVVHFEVSFTDENVDEEIRKQADELQETANKWIPFAGLVALFCII